MPIAIIDYGMGNIHSVNKALQLFGAETSVTDDPRQIARCDKAVLPGVGAFDDAMQVLKDKGLVRVIGDFVSAGKLFLGICLGMQLLFEESEEARSHKGLGILKGKVRKFEPIKGIKVPHMGWNQIYKTENAGKLLDNIEDGAFVYFCHSYYPQPKDESQISAKCAYGVDFAACVQKENVFGAQFHPEKSQRVGLEMIKNFVAIKAPIKE